MSPKFRGRFMALLTKRLKDIGVAIDNRAKKLSFEKDWVVYARPPAKGVKQVLEYIARYTYRVAITNSKILESRILKYPMITRITEKEVSMA